MQNHSNCSYSAGVGVKIQRGVNLTLHHHYTSIETEFLVPPSRQAVIIIAWEGLKKAGKGLEKEPNMYLWVSFSTHQLPHYHRNVALSNKLWAAITVMDRCTASSRLLMKGQKAQAVAERRAMYNLPWTKYFGDSMLHRKCLIKPKNRHAAHYNWSGVLITASCTCTTCLRLLLHLIAVFPPIQPRSRIKPGLTYPSKWIDLIDL